MAVVKESLRITTALTSRLPLVSPEKPLAYKGIEKEWVIPAGVGTHFSLVPMFQSVLIVYESILDVWLT